MNKMNKLNSKIKSKKAFRISEENRTFYLNELERLGIKNTHIAADANKSARSVGYVLDGTFYNRAIHDSIVKLIRASLNARISSATDTIQKSQSTLSQKSLSNV